MKKVLMLMDMPLFPYRIYAYNKLVERGYDLTVVSVSVEKENYSLPLKFKHISLPPKKIGPFVKISSFKTINLDEADVIIVDPNLRMLDYYQFYRNKYWCRLVGWGHHSGRTTGNKLADKFRNRFFRKFQSLVFYDYQTMNEYIVKGFNPQNLFVANNTQYVDITKVNLDSQKEYFLYVGRIQERKRIDIALEAFAELLKVLPNSKFLIVGDGDISSLKKIVSKLGINNSVSFRKGTHNEDDLAKIFNSAIAYVSPGHVGLGVLHSLAFGVPVVTCKDRIHSLEIVNCTEGNSMLVSFDKYSIARAMIDLVEDKVKYEQMSYNAYNHYKDFCTIDKMVDGIDNGIKHILGCGSKRR